MGRECYCLLFVVVAVVPAAAQVDQALAERCFKESQALCERDGGRGSVNYAGATVIPGAGTVYRALATKGAWGSFRAVRP